MSDEPINAEHRALVIRECNRWAARIDEIVDRLTRFGATDDDINSMLSPKRRLSIYCASNSDNN